MTYFCDQTTDRFGDNVQTAAQVSATLKSSWPWTEKSTPLSNMPSDEQARPKISIVTPSFNQAWVIEAAIRSVLET